MRVNPCAETLDARVWALCTESIEFAYRKPTFVGAPGQVVAAYPA